MFSSNYDEWETPKYLFNYLNDIYHFDIDLCANDYNHLCNNYYTIDNSCFNLVCSNKSIFCNPPYGRKIYKFVKFCYELSKYNKVVMLLPARTDTKWFHEFIYRSENKIIFLKGRLHFSNSLNSAPFPSMIVIFGGSYE